MSDSENGNKWEDFSQNKDGVEPEIENNVSNDGEESLSVDSAAGLEHPDYQELEAKLTETEQKAHENWEKSVRALAELENVRRRAEKDVENAHKYGAEKFIKEMLPVIDSLEQALQTSQENDDAIKTMREGIELTLQMFIGALGKFSVTQINPEGEAFDPKMHEAMSMQDSPDATPGSILMVFQKGYLLGERVIRPARVIVAKGKPQSIDEKA